ncbi:RNA-binding protein 25-like isoform X2 [Zerene cesonia]|uniref:RNA-binding protein 25-like isoform X2 n=1 Tax=Zerene cesonia TaxID=33412 RepID=UPI0018E4F631|nr:RNA-binding protein 25-like isoform X2 [Zerene cesonia]
MCSKSDRYLGLPVMLKAGEYSPNNPLTRGERSSGDVLLGLGEYERRRNTLRKIRQRQYREYLDQQAKIKQEEKEKQEREKREREEKERLEEERERERERRELEREGDSDARRGSFSYTRVSGANNAYTTKVDTGVQVDRHMPLSVAVQTDDNDLYTWPPKLTQAERELSPRSVWDGPRTWAGDSRVDMFADRRRSYGDFYTVPAGEVRERASSMSKGDKYRSLQQSYKPSILDADAVSLRNLQAEKEAAARRQYYQQELKNQIQEQQRIREERKNREKMLEQAEMRRLEQQLRSLKMAQERELDRQRVITSSMKYNAADYDIKRTALQRDIDIEQRKLNMASRNALTNKSDPDYIEKPYTMNIPESSIFSQNYDLESYLRKNLNPTKESLMNLPHYKETYRQENMQEPNWQENTSKLDTNEYKWYERKDIQEKMYEQELENKQLQKANKDLDVCGNIQDITRKRHEDRHAKHRNAKLQCEVRNAEKMDTLPIPVLRHSPKRKVNEVNGKYEVNEDMSEEMKVVDDKWKVPAVQKNILKSLQSEGRNINILTQLGSIRRQLQLEQMKLDKIRNTDV